MFWTVLGAYLVGWLLVNLIFNRLLAAATKNQERLDKLKAKGHKEFAAAVVDELERRAKDHKS
jgi:hypothetical protein